MLNSAGILEQSMGARNRVAIGLSYPPTRLHRLVESIPGLLKSLKYRLSCFSLKCVTTTFAPTFFLIVFFSQFLNVEQCLNFRTVYGCRVVLGLSYRPTRPHTYAGGIDSWAPSKFKNTASAFVPFVFFSLFLDVEHCWNFRTIWGEN
jgi:hypothetical protein